MKDETARRKTHTSTEVKARYNKKVYTAVGYQLPKDLVAAFKEKCAAEGVSQAQIIKEAMQKFIEEQDKK